MTNFKNLDVYNEASDLFPKIYRIVKTWEISDQRELGAQIIRAANSVHANIAEGYSKTEKDFKRYLSNSIGSCDELISHINDAHNIDLLDQKRTDELIKDYTIIVKKLTRLKQNWKKF